MTNPSEELRAVAARTAAGGVGLTLLVAGAHADGHLSTRYAQGALGGIIAVLVVLGVALLVDTVRRKVKRHA